MSDQSHAAAAQVCLLGDFRLLVDGRDLALPETVQRLVAVLAISGPMSRRRLAATLWPDRAEGRAMAGVRTLVWRLNGHVEGHCGPLLDTAGCALGLVPDVQVDLHELRRYADAETDAPGRVVRRMLRDGGCDLLPGWDDEWLVLERERVHQLRLHVLDRLALALAEEGDFGAALDAALTSVRIDPLRESAHRTVIRIHLQEGNVSEARRAYATCASLLNEELGVPPSPVTRQLLTPPCETPRSLTAVRP